MITIHDQIAGDNIEFNFVENSNDANKAIAFAMANNILALDTESTGLNCYHPKWKLRTFQFGNAVRAYVIPANAKRTIRKLLELDVRWLGHNGPHDIRCLDVHLGYNTGVICKGETYLPAHHNDSRKQEDGGTGHALKDLAMHHIDWSAGKWEAELKQEFKTIQIPMPGEVYKSGPRKGQQKYRKALMSEGWSLIPLKNKKYIAYAASDPILTYRLWKFYKGTVRQFIDLYRFDHKVQLACDKLQRRALPLDVPYTQRYSAALLAKSQKAIKAATRLGCGNIYSGPQIAETLINLGARLQHRTSKGKYKTDDATLRELLQVHKDDEVSKLIGFILVAKRLSKRRKAYAEAMLQERDINNRVHPSINSLAARTARMSVAEPPLHQLPTKDQENE